MIAYRAMLDVPRELVVKIAGLLRRERRRRGTRRNSRAELLKAGPARPGLVPQERGATAGLSAELTSSGSERARLACLVAEKVIELTVFDAVEEGRDLLKGVAKVDGWVLRVAEQDRVVIACQPDTGVECCASTGFDPFAN